MKCPFLVYRLVPTFYTKTEINFVKEEDLLLTKRGITVLWEKEIYDNSGKITAECRTALQAIAKEQSKKSTRSVCLVYSDNDCDYIEPDGTLLTSNQPPYSTVRLSDGKYETEIISNSGKIEKVNFFPIEGSNKFEEKDKKNKPQTSKIKKLLSILVLLSITFLTGCEITNVEAKKTNCNWTKSKSISAKAKRKSRSNIKSYSKQKT